jgi:hypothetical protein
MHDDDANNLIGWIAALVFVLATLLSQPARASEAGNDPADNASERIPTAVQQGVTCRNGNIENVLPSVWVPNAFWKYLVKVVEHYEKKRKGHK